jgi:hypothetical protein
MPARDSHKKDERQRDKLRKRMKERLRGEVTLDISERSIKVEGISDAEWERAMLEDEEDAA